MFKKMLKSLLRGLRGKNDNEYKKENDKFKINDYADKEIELKDIELEEKSDNIEFETDNEAALIEEVEKFEEVVVVIEEVEKDSEENIEGEEEDAEVEEDLEEDINEEKVSGTELRKTIEDAEENLVYDEIEKEGSVYKDSNIKVYNLNKKEYLHNNKKANLKIGQDYKKFVNYVGTKKKTSDYVVLSFKTTGLDIVNDKIKKIVAVKYENDKAVEIFNMCLNSNYKKNKEVLFEFLAFIEDKVIVTYNAKVNMKLLLKYLYKVNLEKPNNNVIDVLKISKQKVRRYDEKKAQYCKLDCYDIENVKKVFDLENISLKNQLNICGLCAHIYTEMRKCNECIYKIK